MLFFSKSVPQVIEITLISAGTTNTQKDCEASQNAAQEESMCTTDTFMHTHTHSHPHAQ